MAEVWVDDLLDTMDGHASISAAQALADAEMAIREADALVATAVVSPVAVREHLQQLAASFFSERIKNSSTIEAVRAKAAGMLINKIDDETSPTMLMRIIESLGELNGADFQAILAATSGGGKPGLPGAAGGVTNIFMPASGSPTGHSPPAAVTTDTMKMLDSLVQIAETVVAAHGLDSDLGDAARALAEADGVIDSITDVDFDDTDA